MCNIHSFIGSIKIFPPLLVMITPPILLETDLGHQTCEYLEGSLFWSTLQGEILSCVMLFINMLGLQLSMDMVCSSQTPQLPSPSLISLLASQIFGIFPPVTCRSARVLPSLKVNNQSPHTQKSDSSCTFFVDINADLASVFFLIPS